MQQIAMYAFATFFLFRQERAEEVVTARQNARRIVTQEVPRRFLWFRWTERQTVEVGEIDLADFLDRRCYESFEYPYTAFLLVDFLQAVSDALSLEWSAPMQAGLIEIQPAQARRILDWLNQHPPDSASWSQSIAQHDPQMWQHTCELLQEWMAAVQDGYFGLLWLE